jgi:hypothetical protein
MAKEPMSQNQKFTLLVFVLVLGVAVVGAWWLVQSQF